MKALLLIGLQNDYLDGGVLAVPDGDAVVPLANQLQGLFRMVVATQDWHPVAHRSFAPNHTGRVVGELAKWGKFEQLLKPVHCVQNTRGAELSGALMMTRVNKVLRKGTEADVDDYSAFFDGAHVRSTGLSEFLQEKKVKKLYLAGIPTEQAVLPTALDAVAFGFKTWVIEDACRAASTDPAVAKAAFEEMAAAGVNRVQSKELLDDIDFRLGRTASPRSASAS
jgi:nicotinamidase/pyrazinamidase